MTKTKNKIIYRFEAGEVERGDLFKVETILQNFWQNFWYYRKKLNVKILNNQKIYNFCIYTFFT